MFGMKLEIKNTELTMFNQIWEYVKTGSLYFAAFLAVSSAVFLGIIFVSTLLVIVGSIILGFYGVIGLGLLWVVKVLFTSIFL